MNSTYQINKVIAIGFLAVSVLLLFSNLFLVRRVSQDQTAYQLMIEASEPQVGMHVAPLDGYDIDGRKTTIDWRHAPTTIILVMSPTCRACEENWVNWDTLIRSQSGTRAQIAVVDVATNEPPLTKAYIEEHHLEKIPVLTEVTAESIKNYHLQFTPQVITIDQNGIINSVRTGTPTTNEQASVERVQMR